MNTHLTIAMDEVTGADTNRRLAVVPHEQEDMGEHAHTFFELVYIVKGTAFHTLDGASSSLRAGDYFIVDYGSTHSYSKSKGLTVTNCLFLPEVIDETLRECDSFEELMQNCLIRYYKLALGQPFANRVFHDDTGMILYLMEGMLAEYRNRQAGYMEIIRGKLLEILICILRTMLKDQSAVTKSGPVQDAITYINGHFAESRVLGNFCENSHFNPQYISRKFRQETGFTMMEYLQKVRIEKSCELLSGNELRVSEIAQAVGYEDVKYFQGLFARMLHMSPREYRKMMVKGREMY